MDNITINVTESPVEVEIAVTETVNSVSISVTSPVDGREVSMRNNGTYIQWKYEDAVIWTNLIAVADLVGPEGRYITDADFSGNDIVFTMSDSSTVILSGAVTTLKGEKGDKGNNGTDGDDGREIQLQKSATYIQWKYDTDLTWTNLVLLSDLKGDTGLKGDKGDTGNAGYTPIKGVDYFDGTNGIDGADGREVELQNSGTYIQWRYAGDVSWINLIAISLLKGDKGDTGSQGIQGTAGYTPIKGVDYFDGAKGDKGDKGDAGADGVSWEAATFNTTLDFGRGGQKATATITDATITATKIIQCFYTDNLDEVAVLDMRVTERSRTAGVGFEIIGVAPNGAFGVYPVRIITSGA